MYAIERPALLLPKPDQRLRHFLEAGTIYDEFDSKLIYRDLEKLLDATFVHIDIETTGLSPYTKGDTITLIALAGFVKGELVALTFPMPELQELEDTLSFYLQSYLNEGKLIAFNAAFDFSFLYSDCLIDPKGKESLCSLTLFRMLITERASRSLDSLCAYAFRLKDTHKNNLDPLLQKHKLNKGDMSKLLETEDRQLFMKYNLQDAVASCVLFDKWLIPWLKKQEFSESVSAHWHQWGRIISILLEQESHGIKINKERLDAFSASLSKQVIAAKQAFLNHNKVVKWLRLYSKKLIEKWYDGRSLAPTVIKAATPDDLKDDAEYWLFKTSKSKTLNEWQKSIGGYYYKFTIPTPAPKKFTPNIDSDDHLVDFFYNYLYTNWTKEKDFRDKWVVNIELDNGRKETLDCAEQGGLPVNKDYLHLFGKPGLLLLEYRKLETIQQFVTQLYSHMDEDNIVHHRFSPHGAITGRLTASGGINFAQQPKNLEYMQCLSAPSGWKFVQMDFSALEKIVQTQFSNDQLLRKLYASSEKHDVYLYNAKEFYPDPKVREELQKLYEPNEEVLASLKKKFKDVRKVSKGASLSFDYGCGAYTSWKRGRAQGLELTLQDWKFIHTTYWQMYGGVKEFEEKLKMEAEEREGYILSGFGLPLVIEKQKDKDILNTFVQHTGHQVLLLLLDNISKLRLERNLVSKMKPYIADLHDETIWLTKEGYEEQVKKVIEDSLDLVNKELGHEVKFSGVVDVFESMAEIKELE